MQELAVYIPMEVRQALAAGTTLPSRTAGAALFADISGFTPLTAAFSQELGARRGAEELTLQLDRVFSALVDVLHQYRGSVIGFGGDAITCWFDQAANRERSVIHMATAAAMAMQDALANLATVTTPGGRSFPLGIKVAVVGGEARRFVVGLPHIQTFEALAGNTLSRMAIAEHLANRGEVVVGEEIVEELGGLLMIREWRQAEDGERFAVLDRLSQSAPPAPWPAVATLDQETMASWLLPLVHQRLARGEGAFIAALRPVVVMFLRFSGVDYDADEAAGDKLDAFIRWVQEIVFRYEGTLIKLSIGDKGTHITVAFGALIAHEDEARRAIAAALDLRSLPPELGFIRDIQIGISQDQIYAGAYGGTQRRTYGVLGNEVNVAARLMSEANPGDILVTPRIAERAGEAYDLHPLGALTLKGLPEPLPVFTVGRKRTTQPVGRGSVAAGSLVGRTSEKAVLDEHLQGLIDGQSRTLVLEGEAGIGKSRLIEHLFQEAELAAVGLLVGSGDSIERFSPYHAWQPVFRQFFGLEGLAEDVGAGARERWRSHVLARLERLDPGLVPVAPLLNSVLPVDFAESDETIQMGGRVRADNTNDLLVQLLQAAASSGPQLLVLEDAHWLDSASWGLARLAAREVDPLLLVVVTRPLADPLPPEYTILLGAPTTERLVLDTLSRAQIEALVCQRLGVDALPVSVAALIHAKAEGHPFFSEEMAYALRDAGLLEIEDGKARVAAGVANLLEMDFPDTIQGVITSRIDKLPAQHQLTLKVASVIGRIFAYRILSVIHPVEADKDDMLGHLDGLEKLDITLLDTPEPDLSYLFKHIITQEVAYNLLLFRQRYELHEQVARWYEATHGEELSPFYALLAHHWSQAARGQPDEVELTEKAIGFLERAGEQALNTYANDEAVRFFGEAIDLDRSFRGDRPPDAIVHKTVTASGLRRARWHARLAHAHFLLGNLDTSVEHAGHGLALLDQPMPAQRGRQILATLGQVTQQMIGRLRARNARATPIVGGERAVVMEASGLYQDMAKALFHTNEAVPVFYVNTHNLNLSERIGPSPGLARIYANMGLVTEVLQLHTLAESYCLRGLEIARATQDLGAIVTVLITNGVFRLGKGQWDLVSEYLEEGRAIAERLGDYGQWGECVGILADSHLLRGDMQRSLAYYDELLASAQRRNNPLQEGWSMRSRVTNALRQGRAAETIDVLTDTIVGLDRVRDAPTEIDAHGLLAVAYLRMGQLKQAMQTAETASQLIAATSPPVVYPQYLGYGAVAEVYLTLWEQSLRDPSIGLESRALAQQSRQACKNLRSYRRLFSIGGPQERYYQGWYHWLEGKSRSAHKAWLQGLELVQPLRMPHERGLLHFQVGRCLPGDDPQRQEHLRQARNIFSDLEESYYVGLVDAELGTA